MDEEVRGGEGRGAVWVDQAPLLGHLASKPRPLHDAASCPTMIAAYE